MSLAELDPRPRSLRDVSYALGAAVAYFAAAKFGLSLAFATKQVTAVWPPTGVAFVALLLVGFRVWPGIFLGAFLANATAGESLQTAAGIALGNMLCGVLGVGLTRRWAGLDRRLETPRQVLGLVLLGAGLACTVSASGGVANLALAGIVPWSAYASVWWVWWLGDVLGVLLFAPFLLAWLVEPPRRWGGARRLELLLLSLALVALCYVTFAGPVAHTPQLLGLKYTVFPFVIWAAVRFGQREATSASVLISGFAVWGAIHDRGPFSAGPVDERLMLLGVFMAVVTMTAITLGAVVAERQRAEQALSAARDELERRVQERTLELAEEQARLAEAQHLARLGSWQWDVDTDVVTWSDELYRIFGRERGDFGASYVAFMECVHPADKARMAEVVRGALSAREGFQFLHRIVARGATRYVESRATMQLGVDGRVVRMLGTAQDVTEREEQQLKLRESDAFFELSLDLLSTADLHGCFRRVNPAFKLLGYSQEELLTKPFLDFVHPDDVARTLEEVKKLSQGIKTLHFENRYRCKDGSYRWISWVSSPHPDGILYGTGRDVTAEKAAHEEREHLNERLRTLNQDLTRTLKEREVLLQEVHHRVKNNLQVISSLINLQIRKLEPGENRDALEECRTRVQAIALIHEKLYQSSDYAEIPFGEYARSLTSNVFQASAQNTSNVRLELAVDEVALAVDQAIPCGLVLNELITNALKHGFKDGRAGTIRVEFSRTTENGVRLAVKNDGIGLPDDFESPSSPSLGLHLVSTLARQLDAELQVTRDHGTTFQLRFQLPEEHARRAHS
jgi:PAS domain S-box-containing protein